MVLSTILNHIENSSVNPEPIVSKPIETPITAPIESKSTPIEEPVPKKEEVVAQPEPVIIKKEEAAIIDSQVDKEFASDKEQAAKCISFKSFEISFIFCYLSASHAFVLSVKFIYFYWFIFFSF